MDQRELASLGMLGTLAEREVATVDEIHDSLHHTFGRYWGASTGILSPTASQLVDDGHVEVVSEAESVGHRITDEGVDRLRELLREPVEDVSHPSFRPHLMMKLGFLHHLPAGEQREELDGLREQLHAARDRLLTADQSHETEGTDSEAVGYRSELIDLRVRIIDAFVDWLDRVEPAPGDGSTASDPAS